MKALKNYLIVLEILSKNLSPKILRDQDLKNLIKIAENSLKYCDIKPVTSRFSHLYTELHIALSRQQIIRGELWSSIASGDVALYLGRDSQKKENSHSAMLRGIQAWQLGCIGMAKVAFHYTEQLDHEAGQLLQTRLYLIRAYRLSGETDIAEQLLTASYTDYPLNSQWQAQLDFEKNLLQAQKGLNLVELKKNVTKKSEGLSFASIARGKLFLYASSQRELLDRLSHDSGSFEKDHTFDPPAEMSKKLLKAIQDCYDASKPLHFRLESLGKKLDEMQAIRDPELRILFMAAAIRWLYRSKQPAFAKIILELYHGENLRFTDGKSNDVLNLIDSVADRLPELPAVIPSHQTQQKSLGTMARFLKVTQIVTKSVYHLARYRMKRKKSDADFLETQQQVLHQIILGFTNNVGSLRGPMMKIGQYFGISRLLSEESQQIMQQVYNQAAPFKLDKMLEFARQESGIALADHLRHISEDPIGVASIGQVYSAINRENVKLAVKIRYPDIESILRMDLMFLRALSPILRHSLPNTNIGKIWKYFESRFFTECDYLQEAERQKQFYRIFADCKYIKIPQVYPELCSKSVFVTELIEGERLDHFLQDASDAEKERVARQLLYFQLKTTLAHGLWHIDPHPANFIVTNDRLVVIDFGAINDVEAKWTKIHRELARCRVMGDVDHLHEKLLGFGILEPQVIDHQLFCKEIAYHMMAPYQCNYERPFYLENELSLGNMVTQKGLNHGFHLDADDFFSFAVGEYFGELLSSFNISINWHRHYKEILEEIGIIDENHRLLA
ncbi:MAG: AarF/ABC1/UbiB kinase family protein [Oligoflexus sp.]